MYALMVNLKNRNVIGRSLAADAPPTGQSASAAPPEYTTIQSGRRSPFSPMHMDNSLHSCAGSSAHAVTLTVGVELDCRVACLPWEVT